MPIRGRMRKAVIIGAGAPLKIVEDDLPEVPPAGALIRTLYAGICHSDLHFIEDEIPLGKGQFFRNRDVLGEDYVGITLGHEICGVIEQLGEEVLSGTDGFTVGENVCVYTWIGCQECAHCQVGRHNQCLKGQSGTLDIGQGQKYGGGYGTHVAVPKTKYLVKVPENIPMSVACMLPCSAATAYSSLKKARGPIQSAIEAKGRSTLLIIGAGGLGLWCAKLAKKAMFPEKLKVIIADISEEKKKAAVEAGADQVVIWNKDMSVAEMVAMVTNDKEEPVDVVTNFVGSPASVEVGLMALDLGGMQVVLGLAGGMASVCIPLMIAKSLSLVGTRTSTTHELREVVKLVGEKNLGYPELKYFSLEEINTAMEALRAGKIEGRALIKYE